MDIDPDHNSVASIAVTGVLIPQYIDKTYSFMIDMRAFQSQSKAFIYVFCSNRIGAMHPQILWMHGSNSVVTKDT